MGNRKFQVGNRPGQVRRFELDDAPAAAANPAAASRIAQVLAELPLLLADLRSASIYAPESAHRFLAHLGRLLRAEPACLPMPTTPVDLLEDAERFARENAGALMAAAAEPARAAEWRSLWLSSAQELAKSYEDFMDPDSRRSQAEALVASLDEMDLVRLAARRFNHPSSALESAMCDCAKWLSANSHYVLAAEDFVRGELSMIRRDLPLIDRDLATTTTKHLTILGAAEEMEHSFNGTGPIEDQKADYQGRLKGLGAGQSTRYQ